MLNNTKKIKEIEIIKTEIISLKIRVRRIEEMLSTFPNPQDYIRELTEDELYEKAIGIVSQYDRASASLLQRRLAIGYARAARLLDMLEKAKIVGSQDGGKPREVLHNNIKNYLKEEKK